jgi:hypothetical protein
MRKTMRLQTERELIALRDRIKKSEASGAAVNPRAYDLERRLEKRLMADAADRDRLKAFLENRA